jgi:predicted aspartyl protease
MINGRFDEVGHLLFEIELIPDSDSKLPEDAMLDTGFTGFIAMNKQDLDGFEWAYLGKRKMLTARGITTFQEYLGKIILDEQEYQIPVFAGKGLTEILLGSAWLKILSLAVNYQAGILTLGD